MILKLTGVEGGILWGTCARKGLIYDHCTNRLDSMKVGLISVFDTEDFHRTLD